MWKRQNGKNVQNCEDHRNSQNLQDCQNVKFAVLFYQSNGALYKVLWLEIVTYVTSCLRYLSKLNRQVPCLSTGILTKPKFIFAPTILPIHYIKLSM